jgi:hypothetical protein
MLCYNLFCNCCLHMLAERDKRNEGNWQLKNREIYYVYSILIGNMSYTDFGGGYPARNKRI